MPCSVLCAGIWETAEGRGSLGRPPALPPPWVIPVGLLGGWDPPRLVSHSRNSPKSRPVPVSCRQDSQELLQRIPTQISEQLKDKDRTLRALLGTAAELSQRFTATLLLPAHGENRL